MLIQFDFFGCLLILVNISFKSLYVLKLMHFEPFGDIGLIVRRIIKTGNWHQVIVKCIKKRSDIRTGETQITCNSQIILQACLSKTANK